MISLLLLIVATVLFAIAALVSPQRPPVHLGWLGAAFLALALALE